MTLECERALLDASEIITVLKRSSWHGTGGLLKGAEGWVWVPLLEPGLVLAIMFKSIGSGWALPWVCHSFLAF